MSKKLSVALSLGLMALTWAISASANQASFWIGLEIREGVTIQNLHGLSSGETALQPPADFGADYFGADYREDSGSADFAYSPTGLIISILEKNAPEVSFPSIVTLADGTRAALSLKMLPQQNPAGNFTLFLLLIGDKKIPRDALRGQDPLTVIFQ